MRRFDSFGSTDDACVAGINAYQQAHGGRILEPIELPSRRITTRTPFMLWSGLRLHSESPHRACEYRRQTVIEWRGDGALFRFPGSQEAQGYPGDGSPRDCSFRGIQFDGTSANTLLPDYDLTKYGTLGRGHVLWMSEFHGCAFTEFRKINSAWWDGLSISGSTHVQGVDDTPWHVDAAESSLGGLDAFSFMDNSQWAGVAKPFIRYRGRKGSIGQWMITARGLSYQIAVDPGAKNLVMDHVHFDSQDSAPVSGCSVRGNGGQNIVLVNSSFKGQADNLPAAFERGIVHIEGGAGWTIEHNNFLREGTRAPVDTPLVYVGPKVPDRSVKIGLNNFYGYTGVVLQSRPGQVICTDPSITLKVG